MTGVFLLGQPHFVFPEGDGDDKWILNGFIGFGW